MIVNSLSPNQENTKNLYLQSLNQLSYFLQLVQGHPPGYLEDYLESYEFMEP